jgi:enoyl-CoA hydratase/3-hydroxyacyl-CoA dehydrogenase
MHDHTAWIRMNRPEVLNALSKEVFRGMRKSLVAASEDKRARAIVITGSGNAFSSGLDIRQVSKFSSTPAARDFVFGLVKPFWDALFKCEKPVVSMVNGPAYGAGAEIALASDVVVASTRSTFAFSGGKVGALCCISPIIGPAMTRGRIVVEMNLTGEPLTALEAKQAGLVNYAVPAKQLLSATRRILEKIQQVSPISNSSFKRILWTTIPRSSFAMAYTQLLRTITSPDFRRGAEAFRLKQHPNYYD